jgi:transposase-like protein
MWTSIQGSTSTMVCHNCQLAAKKFGKDRKGIQRYRCNACRKTFTELQDRPLGTMRLSIDKVIHVLQLLVEGVSVRSCERVTGVKKKTILSLLECVGERCEMLLETERQHGRPDPDRVCTSHVERQNLTIRMSMRRLTRLTNGFSKNWENLKAAYALHFAYYNFCRIHSSIRCTPAMEAGITKSVWSIRDLLTA